MLNRPSRHESHCTSMLACGQVLRVQTHPLQQFQVGDEVAVEVDAAQCTVFGRAAGDAPS